MARYLVTGATGFLGGHLVGQLVGAGHAVVALCREDEPELEEMGVTVARGGVNDVASVLAAARGVDGAFHCAGKVSRDPRDAEALHRVHVDGTRTVLDACRAARVPRVVVASTSGTVAVSADASHVGNEDDPPPVAIIGRFPYYRTKLYAEELALAASGPGFEVVSVNPTLLLGPGDERRSSTDDVRAFLDGQVPAVPPGGISFVDARDAATGMTLAMDRGQAGRRYLLAACNLTIRDFFARLERISGMKAPWLPVPRLSSLTRPAAQLLAEVSGKRRGGAGRRPALDPVSFEMAQFFWYVDSRRAELELGWRPRDATVTLRETVVDVQARRGARVAPVFERPTAG